MVAISNASSESPCVRNCCLDERDVCLGCGRRLAEILSWHSAAPAQREKIRMLAAQRLGRKTTT